MRAGVVTFEFARDTNPYTAYTDVTAENPPITHREIADGLSINTSGLLKHLDKLKEAGVIQRIGGTRSALGWDGIYPQRAATNVVFSFLGRGMYFV